MFEFERGLSEATPYRANVRVNMLSFDQTAAGFPK